MKIKNIAILGALLPLLVEAKVTLPQFITDSMVVQQNAVLTIPGKAKKNATVKVTPSWDGVTVKTKADKNGNFRAQLNTPSAGGPYSITISDGTPVTLNDVLVGEVWFCSGQSNMEMPVAGWGQVMDYEREVATANNPNLRLLQVKKQIEYAPQEDTEVNMGGWRSTQPETVAEFSSIGYFFGRELQDKLNIPIGIIDCTWGGTPIEAWSSYDMLQEQGEFTNELAEISANSYDTATLTAIFEQQLKEWEDKVIPQSAAIDEQKMIWAPIPVPGTWEDSVLPAYDGVVWMRKVVNLPAEDAGKEATLSLSMIDDEDVSYVNGVKVGTTNTYNGMRRYSVPANVLKEGENTILVRVLDLGGGGGIWGMAEDIYLQVNGKTMPLAGTWDYSIGGEDGVYPPRPVSPLSAGYPTVLYNAMMHPITVMPVKGVLWYQGCANVGRDEQYSKLHKAMIQDWRKEWNNPDMPFYFVQLAGYLAQKRFQEESGWAALRQAQADALELDNTGMAVALDLGNPDDIHPKNKQEVARRLCALALTDQYGQPTECRAPMVKQKKVDGRYVRLTFDAPVTIFGGGQGFDIQGKDGKWTRAYARQLAPEVLEVSCDEIDTPVAIRYNWADYPDGNLRSVGGLPVAPFKLK